MFGRRVNTNVKKNILIKELLNMLEIASLMWYIKGVIRKLVSLTESNIRASVLSNAFNSLRNNHKIARQASQFIYFPQLV